MISLDITLLIQLVNFLISLAIINYLIVRPVRAIIARRRADNDQQRGSAEALLSEASLKMEGYTARIAQARADVAALREQIKKDAQQDAQARVNAAGETARAIYHAATDRVQAEAAEARRELDARVDGFAQVALKSILG